MWGWIKWMGIPIKWRTRIIDWAPPRQFIDLQIAGPYALWHHQHRFDPVDEGIACSDRVIYRIPGGLIGRAMHAVQIRKQLVEIFTYRRQAIREHLGWVRALQDVQVNAIR